jgi:hypothetical protein
MRLMAHRASPVLFRGSSFTSGLHPPGATPQGLNACLYRHWGFPPISSMRFVAHSASFPTEVKDVVARFAQGRAVAAAHVTEMGDAGEVIGFQGF